MKELNKHRSKDLTGKRFGKLVVDRFVGYLPIKEQHFAFWLCKCDCGTTKEIAAKRLLNGDTQSCGCFAIEIRTKHGRNGSREVKSWECIKGRCYNSNNTSYTEYGGVGILMDEEFKKDFNSFIAEIGEMPDGKGWTVDRIDNTKGYVKGNIRWATPEQQARNKGKFSTNSSGFTGVYWKYTNGFTYAVAQWSEYTQSKLMCKLFSAQKYGLLPAFSFACKYRDEQITRLNSLGYDYSENHGK